MKRHLHYESAFEDYLRCRGISYVPVDETRRAVFAGEKVKSFDFLVYPSDTSQWIVDVKGRKFPYTSENGRGTARYWENWVTQEDVDGLSDWQKVFGPDFEARFVFAYLLRGSADRWPVGRPHCFQGEWYAFLTVNLPDYRKHCRSRSSSWGTVSVPRAAFREIARPVGGFCVLKGTREPYRL
jgi:hypothetical protein